MNPSAILVLAVALSAAVATAQEGTTGTGQPLGAGVYQTYGTGCPGSGGAGGVVLPSAFANALGGGGNYFPFGKGGQIYQQVFLGSEVGRTVLMTGLGVRQPNHAGPAGTQTYEALMGVTSYDQTTLTSTFASNDNVQAFQSLFKGQINIPSLGANYDPNFFPLRLPFTRPWPFNAASGNLLVEIINTSTSDVVHGWDWASGPTVTTTRLYASPISATTGSFTRNGGLVFLFTVPGAGSTPALAATGRPVLNTSFSVDLSLAKASTAALLLFGGSKTQWGALSLPLDLTPLGAAGCSLLCSPDIILGLATDASGAAKVPLAIPNDQKLNGLKWFNQYLVLDTVNALQLVFSNGGEATVGDS